jgi:fumarate hydratase class II
MQNQKETYRTESDPMGEVSVPADRLWGAETQRSLQHFSIGDDQVPLEVYEAYGYIKKAAAIVNARLGKLPQAKADLIVRAADEVIAGQWNSEFPVHVWQTGSGTQSNMNVNEVIANRAIQLAGGAMGSKSPIHPNDHVNMSQSSNDTFPTAMHMAAVSFMDKKLLPAVRALRHSVQSKAGTWADVVKVGRTHLQDAVPLTVGQEWSGYATQIEHAAARIERSEHELHALALGGTAVGTGLNTPAGFAEEVAAEIARLTGYPFFTAKNKFAALASLDAMVQAMSALRGLAVALMKIANDIRWLASGPRCGIGELRLPANEPGSSIMPGKVNPSQSEAMIMVCIQVFAADYAVAFAGSQGNFELNTMRPIVIYNFLHSARLLADACENFRVFCVDGIELNRKRIAEFVEKSLMVATALSPSIGYDAAAEIAMNAAEQDLTLREAAIRAEKISEAEFDRLVDPLRMVRPHGPKGR